MTEIVQIGGVAISKNEVLVAQHLATTLALQYHKNRLAFCPLLLYRHITVDNP